MPEFELLPEESFAEESYVRLFKDTNFFRKTSPEGTKVYQAGIIPKGEVILVGKAEEIERLTFKGKKHDFIPRLDDVAMLFSNALNYVRTLDLPVDW